MLRPFVVFASAVLLLVSVFVRGASADEGPARAAQRLVAVLQYVASDYPAAVESQSEVELEEQHAFLGEAQTIAKDLAATYPAAASWSPRLAALDARIEKLEDPAAVKKDALALVEDVVAATGIVRSPRQPPDLARGKALYDAQCASCHGATGAADTEIAGKLDPKPLSFLEGPRADALTAYRIFNTTVFGLQGTAMAAFPNLDEADRWAVAFHVMRLRQGACTGDAPRVSLERLANATDAELATAHGGGAVPCLRAKMPAVDADAQLLFAKGLVERATRLAKAGDGKAARQAILDAYLSGIEPVEPLLRSRDAQLVVQIEEAFLAMRMAIERGDRDVDAHGARIASLLETARRSGSKTTERSVFGLSLLILLREGFEVTVVLGALLAVLKKAGATKQAWIVHAGWIAALIVGALVFFFARKWIAGSNREWVEGVVAIAAVFMLLYAAFWINARANTRKMMGELRDKMKGALSGGSELRVGAGLFVISFSAMLRESVETAMFLQGLAIDSARATAWGALAGLVLLIALVFAMGRFGLKLPMKVLFDVSTAVLFATAVVLLGKGIHALQEVGVVPLRPIPMVRIDLLGVYPDAWSLGAQALLATSPLVWRLLRRDAASASPRTAT